MWICGGVYICGGFKEIYVNLWCFYLWICSGFKLEFMLFFMFDLCYGIFICGFIVLMYVILNIDLLIVEL